MKRLINITLTILVLFLTLSGCTEDTSDIPAQNLDTEQQDSVITKIEEIPEVIEETDTTDTTDNTVITEKPEVPEVSEEIKEEEGIIEEIQEDVPEIVAPPVVEHVPVSGITLSTYDVTLSIGHKTMPYVTMHPADSTNKGEIWTSSDKNVATVDGYGNITGKNEGQCVVTVTSTDNKDVSATVNVTVIPEAECTYIDGILVVNKTYPLPKSYAPGWDETASAQLQVMFAAAKEEGLSFWVKSGYRSYVDQYIIYNDYVARDGVTAADRYSARPGHSEHQSGLAFDLNSLTTAFGETTEGIWLAENCHKYGFIIRYPEDKESVTGYMYEPWHIRYLGADTATAVYESGLCLEEYLGITSKYDE